MTDEEACRVLFGSIGRDHARKIMGRIILEGCDPDEIDPEASVAHAGRFLADHGMNADDVEIAVVEIRRAMIAEGRRLAENLYFSVGNA